MQNQSINIVSSSKVKYTLSNFVLHSFVSNNKSTLSEGNCLILQSTKQMTTQGPNQLYIKFNNNQYCKKINQAVFIKIKYEKSISYIFFQQNDNSLVYTISSYSVNNDISILQAVLSQNASLIDYKSQVLSQEYKKIIDNNIQRVQQNQIIIIWSKTTKIAKGIGSFFGIVNQKITKFTRQADQTINQKIDRFSKDNFSQETHSKWKAFKDQASNINQKVTQFVTPLKVTIQSAAQDISKSYSSSQNAYIKGFRQLTNQTQDALNQGFKSQTSSQPKDHTVLNQASVVVQNSNEPNQYPSL